MFCLLLKKTPTSFRKKNRASQYWHATGLDLDGFSVTGFQPGNELHPKPQHLHFQLNPQQQQKLISAHLKYVEQNTSD